MTSVDLIDRQSARRILSPFILFPPILPWPWCTNDAENGARRTKWWIWNVFAHALHVCNFVLPLSSTLCVLRFRLAARSQVCYRVERHSRAHWYSSSDVSSSPTLSHDVSSPWSPFHRPLHPRHGTKTYFSQQFIHPALLTFQIFLPSRARRG